MIYQKLTFFIYLFFKEIPYPIKYLSAYLVFILLKAEPEPKTKSGHLFGRGPQETGEREQAKLDSEEGKA